MVSVKIVILSACLMLLLVDSPNRISGVVIISPSPKAAICRVRDSLGVTCTTTNRFLRWKLTPMGTTDRITRTLSSTTVNSERVVINSTVFTFSRTSELGSIPLVSRLEISSVNQKLNGTKIACMEVGGSAPVANTTVYIIGNNHVYRPNSPEISFKQEEFGRDRVTVSVEWTSTKELENSFESHVSYGVSIKPSTDVTIVKIDTTRANMTVSYNVRYNVSVVAVFCDQMNTSDVIELMYANCGNPLDQKFENSSLQAISYTNQDQAFEGDIVLFSCPPGLVLTGPNISTCLGNGEWEPDPRDVECKVIEVVIDVTQSQATNDGGLSDLELMNLSHTYFDIPRQSNTQTDDIMKIISITVGTLIGAGFIVLIIAIIFAVLVFSKRVKRKDAWPSSFNDCHDQPLVLTSDIANSESDGTCIHMECIQPNQDFSKDK